MITVRYWDGTDGTINLRFHGHAGAGEKGHDLICAGASTLALTLGRAVELWETEEMLARPAQVRLEEGAAEVTVQPKEEWSAVVWAMFQMVWLGLLRLAEAYPQYVQAKGGEENE